MDKLFGIPMGSLAAILAILLALVLAAVGALALRNRVFLKLGIRSARRRRGRSALIVGGLMLGTTIIAAALASGDTMSHTMRTAAIASLGGTDEVVSAKGADVQALVPLGEAAGGAFFEERFAAEIAERLAAVEHVDGVAPAIIEPVAVQDVETRQSEARVTLFASGGPGLRGFEPIRTEDGDAVTLEQLGPGEVYLNADAAEELAARPGHSVRVLHGERFLRARVRAIVTFDGSGTDGPALLVGLAAGQELVGRPGEIEHVLVSNLGGPIDGVAHTDEILPIVTSTITLTQLVADPIKRDALDAADEQGNAFMSLFTTFGSFSIVAGILLIFLIFVMLAAERRGELGIARAVGTRRGHLVQMFVFEGLAYDLAAAAVGAALGVGVAFAMVFVLDAALGTQGIEIVHDVRARSIVVAYALGVMLTFVVVTASAWRVSRLNIVTAIRNLPEPVAAKARRRWIGGSLAMAAGALLVLSGVSSGRALPFIVGVAALLIGAVPVAHVLGLPQRAAFTVAGLGLVAFNLLPFGWYESLAGTELRMDFSVWIAAGLLVVVGAAWVIVYNADVLLGVLLAVAGRIRSLTPVLRMSIAYPLRSRFRTGITLVMFTLVVFTLVVGATTTGSFMRSFENLDDFGGGFDVRAAAATPVPDPQRALAEVEGVRLVSAQSYLPVLARQEGTGRELVEYPVRGADAPFLANTTWGFGATARGYPDPWQAMLEQPGLAVVDSFVVPRRDNWSAGVIPPDFELTGFFVEDGTFDPIPVMVRDPQTGTTIRLTVIGVLKDFVPYAFGGGITTSQATLERAFGARVEPTIYSLGLEPGVDPRATARALEASFLANGVEAESLQKLLDDSVATSWTFNWLIEGFMGLGLVVGVAALGVISARAVVERRQHIGILRAVGFRRGMIQLSFLLESSFVALTAILVGTALGLVCAANVVRDVAGSAMYEGVTLQIPWLNLTVIFATVYLVALATALAPAVRASRIYPAAALRYE